MGGSREGRGLGEGGSDVREEGRGGLDVAGKGVGGWVRRREEGSKWTGEEGGGRVRTK